VGGDVEGALAHRIVVVEEEDCKEPHKAITPETVSEKRIVGHKLVAKAFRWSSEKS
jgi:hypothetical protein